MGWVDISAFKNVDRIKQGTAEFIYDFVAWQALIVTLQRRHCVVIWRRLYVAVFADIAEQYKNPLTSESRAVRCQFLPHEIKMAYRRSGANKTSIVSMFSEAVCM
ncbi:hypothetical protein [Herbaspirillum rubrisubalbicans]|uniref:hypothetical protein n=1 Tax=Herbaspirillum rubrisubalbicans TaxID=80842 RepID=UPI0011D2666B|nr:hypothetical protein [Herbaspirillum rubrisubalbicans]